MELVQLCKDDNCLVSGFAESRIGGRAENQDNFGECNTPFGHLVTVCDGMGGGPGGRTASSIAVAEIINSVNNALAEDSLSNIVVKAVLRANIAIIEKTKEVPALEGMGSTATVLLVNPHEAVIAHVGDSRVYQLRGKKKVFRTFDHSLVFAQVASGNITEEQARLSAESNVITRALGINPDLNVEVHSVPYIKGDRFMLTTDGIHGAMPEKELIQLATKRQPIGVVVDNIAITVDSLGRSNGGGHDNLTIALLVTNKTSKKQVKMSLYNKIILVILSLLLLLSLGLNVFFLMSNNS